MRTILDKSQLSIILLIVFLLPLAKKNIPLLIGIWILLWLLQGNFKEKFTTLKSSLMFFALIPFYLLHIIGMIYTENISEGLFDLEVKFSLLLFPVIIFSDRNFFLTNKIFIISSFVCGNILAAIVCIANIFFTSKEAAFYYFQYTDFSLFHHTSYAALFALFAVLILISFIIENPFLQLKHSKFIYATLILILLIYIFFLSSRTGTVATILCIGFMAIYLLYLKKKWLLMGSILIVVFAFPAALIKFHPRFIPVVRFIETPADSLNISSGENVSVRYAVVRQSLKLIEENFFTGTGTGDVKDELMQIYKKNNITAAYEQKLNAHNQFLETFISVGVFGFTSLLFLIFNLFYIGIKTKNPLALVFPLLIFLNFLFESMLNTQAGVVFFAFFNCLLLMKEKNQAAPTLSP